LGIGTFKTAHPSYLTLIHLASEGLGRKPNESVALKQMYVHRKSPTKTNPDAWVINRLMPADEYGKIIMEANVLLWATSLIQHFIPDIRFVHAGVAILHERTTAPSVRSLIRCSYLIEERIDEEHDGFYKFINNGSVVPLPQRTTDQSVSAEAVFLSFTQYVQFYKTNLGMVYLPDLQGES
ncbi:hypothetical protein B0H19DRAFT_919391, partial [Mycena capillaripes]